MPHVPARHPTRRRAFTLIELLTVIAVIGILAALIIPTVGKVRQSARATSTISSARQLSAALLLFAGDNRGQFPYASVDNAPAGQQYWPRRLADKLGFNANASRDLFLAASDQVTRRDTNLGATATIPTSFSGHPYLFGAGAYSAATGLTTRKAFPPAQRLNTVKRPSEVVLIITGEPLVNFNAATGTSDGATATFAHLPFTAWNAAATTLNNPLSRIVTTSGFEQIGYYVGSSGSAVVEDGNRSMSTSGRAIAGMADGSVQQFRLGELKVRHVNLVH